MKERRLKQLPVRNERRNSQIVMMVERRRVPRKEIAKSLGISSFTVGQAFANRDTVEVDREIARLYQVGERPKEIRFRLHLRNIWRVYNVVRRWGLLQPA